MDNGKDSILNKDDNSQSLAISSNFVDLKSKDACNINSNDTVIFFFITIGINGWNFITNDNKNTGDHKNKDYKPTK